MTSPLKSRWCGWLLALLAFAELPVEAAGIEEQLKLAKKAGDFPSQIELLRRHLDTVPADAKAREQLVRLWLNEGDFTMAQATLEEWKDAPISLVVLVKAKTLAARENGTAEAIRVLQEFLQQAPPNEEALGLLSLYLAQTQRWPERLTVLDQLEKLNPSASLYLDRAWTRRELMQYAGAIQDAQKAAEWSSDNESLRLAVIPYERLASGLPLIEQTSVVIKKNPSDATARLQRGIALQFGGASNLALADANVAAKSLPDSVTVRILQVLNTSGEGWNDDNEVNRSAPPISPQAAEALIRADLRLAENPADLTVRLERARWLRNAQQPRLGLRDAEEILAAEPANAAALLEMIQANAAMQQPDEAAAYFRRLERAKASPTELADALAVIAQSYFKNYNFSQTLEFADRALALRESEGMLKFKLQALQRLGRNDEARAIEARIQQLKTEKKS